MVKNSITDAVIASSSFTELINTLQTTITGDAQTTGKLMQDSSRLQAIYSQCWIASTPPAFRVN